MEKKIAAIAALIGFTGIILGAFGAHGLKKIVDPDAVVTFETGVRYQVYHALFLLFVGTTTLITEKAKRQIYILTVIGVILFSGSIYLLAINMLLPFNITRFGWITPIGGLLLILGWIVLFLNIIKKK